MPCEFCGKEPYSFTDYTPEAKKAKMYESSGFTQHPTTHRPAKDGASCDVMLGEEVVGWVRWNVKERKHE